MARLTVTALLAVGILVVSVCPTASQEKHKLNGTTQIQTSAAYGKETYESNCANCHGRDARGAGRANTYLNVQPPDLTTLARRHDGKFPTGYVENILRFGGAIRTHGSNEMPAWGQIFEADAHFSQASVNVRIADLINYLKSLQAK